MPEKDVLLRRIKTDKDCFVLLGEDTSKRRKELCDKLNNVEGLIFDRNYYNKNLVASIYVVGSKNSELKLNEIFGNIGNIPYMDHTLELSKTDNYPENSFFSSMWVPLGFGFVPMEFYNEPIFPRTMSSKYLLEEDIEILFKSYKKQNQF